MALLSFVTLPNPTIAAVIPVTVPMKFGLSFGASPAIFAFIVEIIFESLFSAVAIFPNVFNVDGAEPMISATAVSTYVCETPVPELNVPNPTVDIDMLFLTG